MSAERARNSFAEMQNPLFIHPSDGPGSLDVKLKLMGSSNYRSWKRAMEIALSTKRKLPFILGTLARPTDDAVKGEQWDACNNLVIAWLMHSVSDSIAESILYIESAVSIWKHLEKRFAVSNGSRKYKLNRDVYNLKQGGITINEYYTKLRGIWEELNAMNDLPRFTTVSEEITNFLQALAKQNEEQRLFQFLNGLDEVYTSQRSQILLMTPLPSVESVCSMLQQEELQRQVLEDTHTQLESSALLSKHMETKGSAVQCNVCGNKGHSKEKCWQVIGYPNWHPRSKKHPPRRPGNYSPGFKQYQQQFVGKGKEGGNKSANQAELTDSSMPRLTSQQIEQLLKLLPPSASSSAGSIRPSDDTDEEIDYNFAGVATCLHADSVPVDWVIDTGATDHMTSMSSCLDAVKKNGESCCIKLPNGNQVPVAKIGDVHLRNDLTLLDTLVAPEFQYNLLSVSKFCRDNNCLAIFGDSCCLLQDCATGKVKGLGEFKNGLYHLVNSPLEDIPSELLNKGYRLLENLTKIQQGYQGFVGLAHKKADYALWHHRLGHAP